MSNWVSVEGGPQVFKNGLAMGVAIGGGAAEFFRNTHLLVIIHVRLLQKISLHNVTNQTQFKKVNG